MEAQLLNLMIGNLFMNKEVFQEVSIRTSDTVWAGFWLVVLDMYGQWWCIKTYSLWFWRFVHWHVSEAPVPQSRLSGSFWVVCLLRALLYSGFMWQYLIAISPILLQMAMIYVKKGKNQPTHYHNAYNSGNSSGNSISRHIWWELMHNCRIYRSWVTVRSFKHLF